MLENALVDQIDMYESRFVDEKPENYCRHDERNELT